MNYNEIILKVNDENQRAEAIIMIKEVFDKLEENELKLTEMQQNLLSLREINNKMALRLTETETATEVEEELTPEEEFDKLITELKGE